MRLFQDLVSEEVEDPIGDVYVDEDGEGLDGAHVIGLGRRHVVGEAHYRQDEHCCEYGRIYGHLIRLI